MRLRTFLISVLFPAILGCSATAGPCAQSPGKPSAGNSKEIIFQAVAAASAHYRLDPRIVLAVCKQESGFFPRARSHAGAAGAMQFIPETGTRYRLRYKPELGIDDRLDPAKCIWAGCEHLRDLLDFFDGNLDLALAAYNAGTNRVVAAGMTVPNIRETKNYVVSIKAMLARWNAHDREYFAWVGTRTPVSPAVLGTGPVTSFNQSSESPGLDESTSVIYVRRR